MFELLRRLLVGTEAETPPGTPDPVAMASAAGAVMLEVAYADQDLADAELAHVQSALKRLFEISNAQAARILDQARSQYSSQIGLHGFTQELNEHLSHEEKQLLLVELWRLHGLGGRSFHREEHLIRRISDLLYIAHPDFIAAKLASRRSAD